MSDYCQEHPIDRYSMRTTEPNIVRVRKDICPYCEISRLKAENERYRLTIAWKRDDCPVCRIISLEQQLQQAHRDATEEVAKAYKRGWEQAKREAVRLMNSGALQNRVDRLIYPAGVSIVITDAIAAMEYKEKAND